MQFENNLLDELVENFPYQIHQIRGPNGELVWVQKGINPDNIFDDKRKSDWPFSQVIADLICGQIVEGQSLLSICRQEGFPSYAIVCRWKNEQPLFKADLEAAYEDRREFFIEKILALIDEIKSGDSIKKISLMLDAFKWCAGGTMVSERKKKNREAFYRISIGPSVDV